MQRTHDFEPLALACLAATALNLGCSSSSSSATHPRPQTECPSDIFAVGGGGTILCYDGNTWEPMSAPTFRRLRNIWGVADGPVYAVGQGGVILALER